MRIREAIRLARNKGDWNNDSSAFVVCYDAEFRRHETFFALDLEDKEKELIKKWSETSGDMSDRILALRSVHF